MTTETRRSTVHYDAKAPRFKNWETPPDFFRKLDTEFHFTLDVAASHENALTPRYCTLDGTFTKGGIDGFSPNPIQHNNRDGLDVSWETMCIFCNPPYDSSIHRWVDKAFQFEAEVSVLLLPPSFDTAWGQRIWEAYKTSAALAEYTRKPMSVEIRLPPGRLRFFRPAFKHAKSTLKDYEVYGEEIFDYSKPHVLGEAPRAGNLIVIFRR